MLRSLTTIVVSAAALAATGCVLDKEVSTEITGVCATGIDLAFEPTTGDSAVANAVVGDVGIVTGRADGAEATVTELVFTPNGGVSSLAFAEAARVDVAALNLPRVRIVDTELSRGSPVVASADSSINIVEYLLADAVGIQVEISGPMPVEPWSVNLELCMDVRGVNFE